MPVFNGGRYLSSALESVLSQEGIDLELVVVDDGSTDGSSQVLEDYRARDPRLRVLRQANGGCTRALARGCGEARGRFIARQDADDLSSPGRLRAFAAILDARLEVAVVSSWVENVGPDDEYLSNTVFPEGLEAGTRTVVEQGRNPVHGATMFRKVDYDAVGGYRSQFFVAQDADLWLRLTERGGVLFLPAVYYRFRVSEGSVSSRHGAAQTRLHELARRCRNARAAGESEAPHLEEAARVRPQGGVARRKSRGAGLYFIGRTLIRNQDGRATKYLGEFVRRRPLSPKGWISLVQAMLLPRPRSREGRQG